MVVVVVVVIVVVVVVVIVIFVGQRNTFKFGGKLDEVQLSHNPRKLNFKVW